MSREIHDEDVLTILVATNIHLGYAEGDPILGRDTFETFKEILEISKNKEVDFILLGGNLFHDTQPSVHCLNKCMKLLKEYCLGDRLVYLEFLSNPSKHFNKVVVNYEDPNMNISLPIFSIHGNHDGLTGPTNISSLDILSNSRYINYFGKWDNSDQLEISPILLQKGKSKLSIYGVSHIRDEQLAKLFLDKKVNILSPLDRDDWFNLFIWHQNRAPRSSKNFKPEKYLPGFLDMVIWGHEHDCRIIPKESVNGLLISQPGSTVATSLNEGESITKHVGILKIRGKQCEMIPVELKSVRPFKYAEISLNDKEQWNCDENTSGISLVKKIVVNKINGMIRQAKELGRDRKVSEKPLIRLIVKYKDDSNIFNTIRFGQSYTDKVANPESMVQFRLIKDLSQRRCQNANQHEEEAAHGPILANRIEDLVTQHFNEHESLIFLLVNLINESVKKFIDANDNNAIADVTDNLIKEMLKTLETEMPPIESTREAIKMIKNRMEENFVSFVEKFSKDRNEQKKKVTNRNDKEGDYAVKNSDLMLVARDRDSASKKKVTNHNDKSSGNAIKDSGGKKPAAQDRINSCGKMPAVRNGRDNRDKILVAKDIGAATVSITVIDSDEDTDFSARGDSVKKPAAKDKGGKKLTARGRGGSRDQMPNKRDKYNTSKKKLTNYNDKVSHYAVKDSGAATATIIVIDSDEDTDFSAEDGSEKKSAAIDKGGKKPTARGRDDSSDQMPTTTTRDSASKKKVTNHSNEDDSETMGRAQESVLINASAIRAQQDTEESDDDDDRMSIVSDGEGDTFRKYVMNRRKISKAGGATRRKNGLFGPLV